MQLLIFYEVWKYEHKKKTPSYLPLFSFCCCFNMKISPSCLCHEYALITVKNPTVMESILFIGIFPNQSPFIFVSFGFPPFPTEIRGLLHMSVLALVSFSFFPCFFFLTYQSLFPVKSQQGLCLLAFLDGIACNVSIYM